MTAPAPPPPPALVSFVLAHAQMSTNVCTRQQGEQAYELLPRTVPDYNLIYVTRGRVVWVVEDQEIELRPGEMVLVPPGVPHRAFSRTKRFTLGSIHFDVRLAGRQDVFELLTPPPFQRVEDGSRLDRYLRMAMEEFDRPDPTEARLMLAAWGRLVALELLRDNADRGLLRHRALDPLVAELMEQLNADYQAPFTLDELAARAGYSAQHLNRLFRREVGMTPLQYLTRLRMDHAAAMLVDGRLTVRAVGERVGYDDPYYFSRVFKQHFGRSPAQYREAAGPTAGPPPEQADSNSPSPRSTAPFTAPPPRR